jgi:hypothetical protein
MQTFFNLEGADVVKADLKHLHLIQMESFYLDHSEGTISLDSINFVDCDEDFSDTMMKKLVKTKVLQIALGRRHNAPTRPVKIPTIPGTLLKGTLIFGYQGREILVTKSFRLDTPQHKGGSS